VKLKGEVAVITGAGRNIGKAMAKLFATEGAKIAVAEMHEGRGQSVVDEINNSGHEAMLVLCDVANSADVKEMVQKVVAKFGAIDVLVNNAALTDHATILDSTEEEFDKVIRRQSQRPVSGDQVRRRANGAARSGRQDCQFRFDVGNDWASRRHCLRRRQSRGDQYDARHGRAACSLQDSRELRRA
jgi:NAD(P)-dependent dehydrogenase (short-subunit alcohol dehydrogenase family)